MHINEIISTLINRVRQNNTDNQAIRKTYYELLDIIRREINDSFVDTPSLVGYPNTDAFTIICYYGQANRTKALQGAYDLVCDAIKEQNKLIKEEYNKQFEE